ncbi:Wzz/FepE/Etk N-terminal domain-containing protein [Butyrivibrio sp. INlla16]|uniref:Wzz/FepE/Etk N-terminal domain-containing protein n=2 Tax=Butyrivibrio sp. INlla16 TaxID=1520807 RepID=UPI00088AAAA3|nr:Wzz/FepE/Etk N-terminal domain-containing protein [Butyrivibrio sp. INlla16]SDB69139.1 Capsular polysaccharide biosynthesis protein [Butyrivibrio sp. INlla16]
MYKNEIEIDIFRCINALKKNIKFIAIITVLFFLVGLGVTLDKGNDTFGAKATVYASAVNSYSDAANAVTAMNAYMDVAKSYKVCQRAALILGRSDVETSDIQNSISVYSSQDTNSLSSALAKANSATIISFTARTSDPDLSMAMADAMAQAYTIEMANILRADSVKVLDNAYTYYMAHDANKSAWKKRIIAMMVGFALSSFGVILFEILDKNVRTVREATIGNSLPVIGIIPEYKE